MESEKKHLKVNTLNITLTSKGKSFGWVASSRAGPLESATAFTAGHVTRWAPCPYHHPFIFFRRVRLSQGGFIPNNKACPSRRAVKPDFKIFKRARGRIKFLTVR